LGILSNISGKDAVKVFAKVGYYLDHQEGSQMILYCQKPGLAPLSVPNHNN